MPTWRDFEPARKRPIKMLTNGGKDWKKMKKKEKKQFENATHLGERCGNQEKIGIRKKNSTHQENWK